MSLKKKDVTLFCSFFYFFIFGFYISKNCKYLSYILITKIIICVFSLRRREIFSVFVIETTVALFSRQKKMPIFQSQNFNDFSTGTLDEKIDFMYELLDRQRDVARFTLENLDNLTKEKIIFLQFIIVICNTNFAVVLVNFIENRVYSDIDFLTFYSRKLDEQLDDNIEINFLVHD